MLGVQQPMFVRIARKDIISTKRVRRCKIIASAAPKEDTKQQPVLHRLSRAQNAPMVRMPTPIPTPLAVIAKSVRLEGLATNTE